MPEEWERDASMIPDNMAVGRYVFWGWKDAVSEQATMPFNGTSATWPGLLNVSDQSYNDSLEAPGSMGVLFRDPSTFALFQQGNKPFQAHLKTAGIAPTSQWPSLIYGTLPRAWGQLQPDTNASTFPNLEVMCVRHDHRRHALWREKHHFLYKILSKLSYIKSMSLTLLLLLHMHA